MRHGPVSYPNELADWPSLIRGTAEEDPHWVLANEAGEEVRVRHRPRYRTTDMLALKAAALKGVARAAAGIDAAR